MRRPVHGCQHVGSVVYATLSAACSRCGAEWWRGTDTPWRLVRAGSEPAIAEAFACDGCGAQYREAPRTCFVCGRPSRGLELKVLEAIESAAETAFGRHNEPAPLEHADGGMRAD